MPSVLFVDDDESLREFVQEFLIFSGYTIISCGSGREAMTKLGLMRFDIILLDNQLEDMSGLEVLKQYRASGGIAPVVMLSGANSQAVKEEALAAGANLYVRKPFKLNELGDILTKVLTNS